jgi:hypothetical protein
MDSRTKKNKKVHNPVSLLLRPSAKENQTFLEKNKDTLKVSFLNPRKNKDTHKVSFLNPSQLLNR